MRRNVEHNAENVVSKTVADFVSRTLAGFHDKAVFRTIKIEVGNNVAEFEGEFDPALKDRFAAESVVRSVAGGASA